MFVIGIKIGGSHVYVGGLTTAGIGPRVIGCYELGARKAVGGMKNASNLHPLYPLARLPAHWRQLTSL
jgi:hypothetical protein